MVTPVKSPIAPSKPECMGLVRTADGAQHALLRPDSGSASLWRRLPGEAWKERNIGVEPKGVSLAADAAGRLFVGTTNGKVELYDGKAATLLAGPKAAADALAAPSGLAIDPKGRLAIVDGGTNQIRYLPAGAF